MSPPHHPLPLKVPGRICGQMKKIEKVGEVVFIASPGLPVSPTGGTQMEPYGRWGVSSLVEEMIITHLVASCRKRCLSWGSLHYLLDTSASPGEMQQWKEAGSELRLWCCPLSGLSLVHKRHSCVDLQSTSELLFGDFCPKGISIPGIH